MCPDGKTTYNGKYCRDCKEGYECIVVGDIKKELMCKENFYSPGGQSACSACPKYTVSARGATDCNYCPSGQGYHWTSKSCKKCVTGRFSKNGLCTLCPTGKTSNDNNTGCRDCKPGHKCIFGGGGKLEVECPQNHFSVGGADKCTHCPTGKNSEPGSSSCNRVNCPVGEVYNDALLKCVSCLDGQYAANGFCNLCPDGKWHKSDHSSCVDCRAGYKCFVSGRIKEIEICPLNHYAPKGSSKCIECKGPTVSEAGASVCEICPAGTGYNTGNCFACTSGRFSSSTGWCTPCPPGYINERDHKSCKKCPAGTACPQGRYKTELNSCPANTYSNEGASKCTNCPTGQTSGEGSSSCNACPAGQGYSTSANKCLLCSYGSIPVKGFCSRCPDGKISNSRRTVCIACRKGYKCVNTSSTTRRFLKLSQLFRQVKTTYSKNLRKVDKKSVQLLKKRLVESLR